MVQMKGIVLSLLSITVKVTHQLRFIQVFLLFSFFLKPKTTKRQLIQIWLNHSFHFLGPKCDFLDAEKLAQGFNFIFFSSFSLSFFDEKEGVVYDTTRLPSQPKYQTVIQTLYHGNG